jgi:pyrroloquinoline quinone biosynthesis protein B
VKIKVLGSGQDDGIPQIGCYCKSCSNARKSKKSRRLGPSIALIDQAKKSCFLIDASPDFKYQIDLLKDEGVKTSRKGKLPISGILLTHAHFGHCSGLWYLGRESVEEKKLPVYCTQKMGYFLNTHYPFNLLVNRGNVILREVSPEKRLNLKGIGIIPVQVPHRSEIADTIGFKVVAQKSSVLYVPDVDEWTDKLVNDILGVDIAIIDGTFLSEDELPRYSDVPHPPIEETIKLLRNLKTEIYFTHINHTNPVNYDRIIKRKIEKQGFHIAYDGMTLAL